MIENQAVVEMIKCLNALKNPNFIFWGIIFILILRGVGLALIYKHNGHRESYLLGLFPLFEVIPKFQISNIPLNVLIVPITLVIISIFKNNHIAHKLINPIDTTSFSTSFVAVILVLSYVAIEYFFLTSIGKSSLWIIPLPLLFAPIAFERIPQNLAEIALGMGALGTLLYSVNLFYWGVSKKTLKLTNYISFKDVNRIAVAKNDTFMNPYLASYIAKEEKEKCKIQYIPVDNKSAYNLGASLNNRESNIKISAAEYVTKFFKSECKNMSSNRDMRNEVKLHNRNILSDNEELNFESFLENTKKEG